MPVVPCPSPCPPITRGVVVFDAQEFIDAWPDFTGITNGQMATAFNLAQLVLNNSCGSIIEDANVRLTLLYMVTAHVAFLLYGTNDGAGNVVPPPGIVGRINAAAEGSVSVQAEYASEVSESLAWFSQTKYGAMFWQATAQYRTMHYIGAPESGPNGPGGPFGWQGFTQIE